jgi:hypothetical protein
MRDDFGADTLELDRSEHHVGVVSIENQVTDRLGTYRPNRADHRPGLRRTRHSTDCDHPLFRYHESGIGASLGTLACVSQYGVDAVAQFA